MRGYEALFELGLAHSVAAWDGDRLVGGLFGVALGRFITAESMFHTAPDGGNAAIAGLIHIARANDFALIDVQMQSPHVMRFGASLMDADEFVEALAKAIDG
jgi:leucyl/phenylalanyl-tRNA--protein transferase